MSRDKRNTLSQRKRAQNYGVEHVPYSRDEVFARWDFRCIFCNSPAEHLDHLLPLSRGGGDVLENVAPACAECNLERGNKTLAEWVEYWTHKNSSTDSET